MVQPFLSLCVIFRNNIDTLPKLLESVAGCFDEYIFTDTGAKDGSRRLVEQFLADKEGKVTEFAWIDDFSAARNACFQAASGRWRMFLDSDDQLMEGKKLRPLLMKMEAQHPQVEAMFVKYDYATLEELPTMRICRWREGWGFNDAIHERLEFSYPDGTKLPDDAFAKTQDVWVLHKDKTPEEKILAIRRNARIAEREYTKTQDVKYRARLARTIAMEMKMDGKAEETIPLLAELWNHYRSFPEGRQAAADISKAYQHLAEPMTDEAQKRDTLMKGLMWAKRAGPAYEGLIQFVLGNHEEVLKCAQRSLGRGQQTTHEGFVFEQGAIYVAAATSALRLGRLDEAEHILNYIPPKLRNHEALSLHINGVRATVDRITIVVPGTPQPFDEKGGGGMLGGSEEAVLYLSRALAELGRKVRVYTLLPPHRIPGRDAQGIDWQPISAFNVDEEHGTLVLWRAPGLLLQLMQRCAQTQTPLPGVVNAYLWLHDSGLGLPRDQAAHLAKGCEGAIVLSDFHERMVRRNGYTGKTIKLSNGIVEEDFEPYIDDDKFGFPAYGIEPTTPGSCRDAKRVVYSSCPSRGLVQLLKMWPEVKAEVPDAKLDIYYDWSMLEVMQPAKYDEVVALYETVKDMDVVHHGGVDHQTLHEALRWANVWAYSHFESPEVETFCISAIKAQACGAAVLSVPNGALPEVTADDACLVKDPAQYRDVLIEMLKNPWPVGERQAIAKRALKRYGWKAVAERFSKVWSVRTKIKLISPDQV
jgi:glycosyltransferase involved in cell wall biosynthesis